MTCLIAGASAGLGRALAERCAATGRPLLLVASDARDLEAQAQDLRLRFGTSVTTVAADAGETESFVERIARAATDAALTAALFPLGVTALADEGLMTTGDAERLVRVNFLALAQTLARLLPGLRSRPSATVVGFGSIAAARGRNRNVIYSAAKRALESYFESLRHACAGSPVRVQFYVLGYLDTQQAFGRPTLLPRAAVEPLAARVVRDLGRDFGTRYHPAYWRPICAGLRRLPWPLYRRLGF